MNSRYIINPSGHPNQSSSYLRLRTLIRRSATDAIRLYFSPIRELSSSMRGRFRIGAIKLQPDQLDRNDLSSDPASDARALASANSTMPVDSSPESIPESTAGVKPALLIRRLDDAARLLNDFGVGRAPSEDIESIAMPLLLFANDSAHSVQGVTSEATASVVSVLIGSYLEGQKILDVCRGLAAERSRVCHDLAQHGIHIEASRFQRVIRDSVGLIPRLVRSHLASDQAELERGLLKRLTRNELDDLRNDSLLAWDSTESQVRDFLLREHWPADDSGKLEIVLRLSESFDEFSERVRSLEIQLNDTYELAAREYFQERGLVQPLLAALLQSERSLEHASKQFSKIRRQVKQDAWALATARSRITCEFVSSALERWTNVRRRFSANHHKLVGAGRVISYVSELTVLALEVAKEARTLRQLQLTVSSQALTHGDLPVAEVQRYLDRVGAACVVLSPIWRWRIAATRKQQQAALEAAVLLHDDRDSASTIARQLFEYGLRSSPLYSGLTRDKSNDLVVLFGSLDVLANGTAVALVRWLEEFFGEVTGSHWETSEAFVDDLHRIWAIAHSDRLHVLGEVRAAAAEVENRLLWSVTSIDELGVVAAGSDEPF